MGLNNIEGLAKGLLEPFPGLKNALNRVYRTAAYALSRNKIVCEGELTRLTPDDGFEYFFGYYDKSPWDAADRRVIALKVKDTHASPAPAEPGELVLIDTGDGNKVLPVATVNAWNVQQGCMAQWLGPGFDRYILYNDFRDGRFCAVIYDANERREVRTLPLPAYDVAKDGSFALSLDFSRLHRLRPGYGYSNLPDTTAGQRCPDSPCIWRMELATGAVRPLLKYTDLAAFEPDPSMSGAEHKVNHLMICPDGSRFMALHRWFDRGHKHTRLVTANCDGTGLFNLSDDGFASHSYWKNDREILSFLNKEGTGKRYYLMRDRSREYRALWPELTTDGHCSYSPDGSRVVTDTYPNRSRLASVYVCAEHRAHPLRVARVFSPLRYFGDCRCDLHPRWNRAGDRLCIDSVHEGRRALYAIPAPPPFAPAAPDRREPDPDAPLRVLMVNTVPMIYDGITMVMLNYVQNMARDGVQVDFLCGNDVEPSLRATIEDMGVRLYRIPGRNRHPVRYVRRLAALCRQNGYQVVHAHGNSATLATEMLAAKRAGVPVRCPHSHSAKTNHPALHKALGPLFARSYTHGFACGEAAGRWLYGDRPFTVLNNGANAAKYGFNAAWRAEYRDKLGIGDRVAVGHVANFTPHKNHTFLIEAFDKLAKRDGRYVLVLVGSGRLMPQARELVKQKGLEDSVIFVGTTLEIPQVLSAMDFMVLPSLYEGMPNVLIEWQASGLPALVADTVTPECRLTPLVDFLPLDVEAWAKGMAGVKWRIDRAAASADSIRAIVAAGYDIRANAALLEALYREYAAGAGPR